MHKGLVLTALIGSTLVACSDDSDRTETTAINVTTISVHPIAAPEGGDGDTGSISFKLSATKPLTQAVSIAYKTVDGTAIAGQDYQASEGQVSIASDATETSISVPLIGDDEEESQEAFSLSLELVGNGAFKLSESTVKGTVANDDSSCSLPYVNSPNPFLVTDGKVMNYAHRGGVIDFPENTLYAYKEVAKANADVLEMDVYQTLDNELVVIHDLDVDRTTNGTGNIRDLTLAELRALDAAYWFVQDEGTPHDAEESAYLFRGVATGKVAPPEGYTANDFRIPTLEEALQAFPDHLINIELKPDLDGVGNYEQQIAELLIKYGRINNLIAASFMDEAAEKFKRVAPCIYTSVPLNQATGLILGSQGAPTMPPVPEHIAFQVPPDTSHVQQVPDGLTVVTQDLIDDVHAIGLAIQVWTINDCPTMIKLIDMGVDAIMTDRPILLQKVLEQAADSRSCDGLQAPAPV